jgi:hypothetical protein
MPIGAGVVGTTVGITVAGVVMLKWPTSMRAGVTVSRGMVALADMAASDAAVVVDMAVAIADRTSKCNERNDRNHEEACRGR